MVDKYMYVPNMLSSKNKDISIIIIISGNAKGVMDLHTCSKKSIYLKCMGFSKFYRSFCNRQGAQHFQTFFVLVVI